ncbi:hypothetical protein BJX70DRAFT_400491 [Aspergillus crustosus]
MAVASNIPPIAPKDPREAWTRYFRAPITVLPFRGIGFMIVRLDCIKEPPFFPTSAVFHNIKFNVLDYRYPIYNYARPPPRTTFSHSQKDPTPKNWEELGDWRSAASQAQYHTYRSCSLVIVKPANPLEIRRQQHAQAQKQQRDRMKAALDRIAQIMEVGGVNEGTSGTKAELLETAVDYIQTLQGQIEELRGSSHATAAV